MPYIKPSHRPAIDAALVKLVEYIRSDGLDTGELNYVLTRIVMQWALNEGASYMVLSDVIKTLECVKLEFYRRVVEPYEEIKRAENGDVPEFRHDIEVKDE